MSYGAADTRCTKHIRLHCILFQHRTLCVLLFLVAAAGWLIFIHVVYSNTLMATLNCRVGIRAAQAQSISLSTFGPAPISPITPIPATV